MRTMEVLSSLNPFGMLSADEVRSRESDIAAYAEYAAQNLPTGWYGGRFPPFRLNGEWLDFRIRREEGLELLRRNEYYWLVIIHPASTQA